MNEGCRDHFERMSEYLDGELDSRAVKEIDEHLKACPECRTCFESLKKGVQLCKEAAHEDMPPYIKERLRSTLLECFSRRQIM